MRLSLDLVLALSPLPFSFSPQGNRGGHLLHDVLPRATRSVRVRVKGWVSVRVRIRVRVRVLNLYTIIFDCYWIFL